MATPIVTFAPAVREGSHVIITAYGESGCGKTYSLICLGRGLVGPKGRLGLLDTETGRGKIYSGVAGGFLYAELTPPFTPERYIEAIDAAETAGIDALIIDSGSHEWEGIGGILDLADTQKSQSGAALQGLVKWAKPKARHKKYVQRLLNSRMHLLISLRAKEKMVQLTDKMKVPNGAKVGDIISDGYIPIQDKRFIFETTVQLFLPTSRDRNTLGIPIVEKCPEDLWGAFPDGARISEDTGSKIAEWVAGGAPIDHAYMALKRGAEAAAGGGLDELRSHWRTLNKSARERLAPDQENLTSIARAADAEKEERRRERETSHTAFGQIEPSHAADEDPFGLPPLPERGEPSGISGQLPQPQEDPRLRRLRQLRRTAGIPEGGEAPDALLLEAGFSQEEINEERSTRGWQQSHSPAGWHPADGARDEPADQPPSEPAGEHAMPDLLGGEPRPPASRAYQLPSRPTPKDMQAFADWIDGELADGVPGRLLRANNDTTLRHMKVNVPDLYDAVQRKLGIM